VRLINDPAVSQFAFIAVSGSVVHVVWQDNRDGNNELYYKRSSNSGLTWGDDERLTIDPASTGYPFAAASGSDVHVVWNDYRDGTLKYITNTHRTVA